MKQSIYIIFIVLLTSCSKSEQFQSTEVSGEVINGITGNVFTRGTVELIEIETPLEPFTQIIEQIVDEQEVNANGAFKFEFNAKRGSRYTYRLDYQFPAEEHFVNGGKDGNAGVERIILEKKATADENFIIFPACELKFLVYNQNGYDENDSLLIYQITEARGKSPSGAYIGRGEYETDFFERVSGQMTIQWHVTRNGQTEVYSDEIFVEHNERRVYEIYY